jgi:hypothetical protein
MKKVLLCQLHTGGLFILKLPNTYGMSRHCEPRGDEAIPELALRLLTALRAAQVSSGYALLAMTKLFLWFEIKFSGNTSIRPTFFDTKRDKGAELMSFWIAIELRRTNEICVARVDHGSRGGNWASIQLYETIRAGG